MFESDGTIICFHSQSTFDINFQIVAQNVVLKFNPSVFDVFSRENIIFKKV